MLYYFTLWHRLFRPRLAATLLLVLGIIHSASAQGGAGTGTDAPPSMAPPDTALSDVEIDADHFEFRDGRAIARGHVRVRYQELKIEADSVWIEAKNKDFAAEGNVLLIRGDMQWDAESMSGNLDTRSFVFSQNFAKAPPWYMKAGNARRDIDGVIHMDDVRVSTCDHVYHRKWPHWGMSARSIRRSPDNVYYARHVIIRILGIPVFYLPALYWDDTWWTPEITQGHEKNWGYWVRLGVGYQYRKMVKGKLFIESRQKRGEGGGTSGVIRADRLAIRYLLWGIQDRNPLSDQTIDGTPYNRRFKARPEHYRADLFMLYQPWDDLDLRARLDWQSDHDTLFEFFNRHYRENPEPASYLDLSYLRPRYELALHHRPRVNDFHSTQEQLPELRFQMPRQDLFDSGLYYQGSTRAGNYRMRFRDYDLPRDDGTLDQRDYTAFRADSAHVLYHPLQLGWLNLLPRAGIRATYYSDSSDQPVTDAQIIANMAADRRRALASVTAPVTDYDTLGGEQWRWAHELGLEASFKASRLWPDYRGGSWMQIKGLRHVVEPYANYTYIPKPTKDKDHLYFFDEVDRMDKVHFIRLGLRQYLQTRRGENLETHSLLNFETYLDYFIDPADDRPKAGDFGGLLSFDPHAAFNTTLKCLIDSHDGRLNVFNSQMRLGREKRLHSTFDFFYRDEHRQRYVYSFGSDLTRVFSSGVFPLSFDQNRSLTVSLHVPLTDDLKFNARHYYDLDPPTARNRELAQQRYGITMNLHCWAAEVAYDRNNDAERVMFTLYLRAFPDSRMTFSDAIGSPNNE